MPQCELDVEAKHTFSWKRNDTMVVFCFILSVAVKLVACKLSSLGKQVRRREAMLWCSWVYTVFLQNE